MRYIVYGAGAVGGVLAAALSGVGYPVAVLSRGAHLDAIRRDGLRVISPNGEEIHQFPAYSQPSEVDWQPDDIVLLAVKSMDTAAALRELAAHAHPATAVVCVQNGVANEPAALRMFAEVYGVYVMFPAAHLIPGTVVAYSAPVLGILDIGRYPSSTPEPDSTQRPDGESSAVDCAADIAEAFEAAAFASRARTDIMRWKYAKLLGNLANAVEAICGSLDAADETVRRARAEGEAVLRAAGISFASVEEEAERRGDIVRIKPVYGATRGGGSSWQSLTRGTGSIETDYLNGEIVLLGRQHNVPTPVNEFIQRLANQYAREGITPGKLSADQLASILPD